MPSDVINDQLEQLNIKTNIELASSISVSSSPQHARFGYFPQHRPTPDPPPISCLPLKALLPHSLAYTGVWSSGRRVGSVDCSHPISGDPLSGPQGLGVQRESVWSTWNCPHPKRVPTEELAFPSRLTFTFVYNIPRFICLPIIPHTP